MQMKSTILGVFLLTALFACTPEDRNYGGEGGAGAQGGSGSQGGQGGAGGQGGDPAIVAACTDYGIAVCDHFAQCSPASITASFGEDKTCRARYALYCDALLRAPGTGWTPDSFRACFQTYAGMDCNLFLALPFRSADETLPMECIAPAGLGPSGGTCLDHAQCMSGVCHRPAGAFCGTCGPAGDGTPCVLSSECLPHQTCFKGACTPAGELGAACDATIPCNAPWTCFGGMCVKPGYPGDVCGGNGPDCNFLLGLTCNTSTTYMCEQIVYAAAGEPCGKMGELTISCSASGLCHNGVCVPASLDGESCDPVNGKGCMAPSICLNGKCRPPDAAACN